jgi:hypothetical protein
VLLVARIAPESFLIAGWQILATVTGKTERRGSSLPRRSFSPKRQPSRSALLLAQPLIITVIGKAFFDISHAPADHSNRRTDLQGYAVWEIHPVMKLEVLK